MLGLVTYSRRWIVFPLLSYAASNKIAALKKQERVDLERSFAFARSHLSL